MSLLDALAAAAASVGGPKDEEGVDGGLGVGSPALGAPYQRRTRPTHSKFQKAVMQSYFEFNKLPDAKERVAIGQAVGLTARAVHIS